MTDIHAIRLRRPWTRRPLEPPEGMIRFERRFHRPTGVEPHETVYLAIAASAAVAQVRLNGHLLAEPPQPEAAAWRRFDLTDRLAEWNTLELDLPLSGSGQPPGAADRVDAPCAVRLEIHGVGPRGV